MHRIAFFLIIFPFALIHGIEPYAVKPDWWDSVEVEIEQKDNLRNSYSASRPEYSSSWREIERWRVLGPLDSFGNSGFERVYGPEEKLDLKAKLPAKGGTEIGWRDWDSEKNLPIPKNETNFIAFFLSSLRVKNAGAYYLLITSDDGCEVWIDGKKEYSYTGDRGMNTDNPDVVSLDLPSEKAVSILVKLQQGIGDWGFKAWLTRENPTLYDIKLRSLLVPLFPDDQQGLKEFSRDIASICRSAGEWDNSWYWERIYIKSTEERYAGNRIRDLYNEFRDLEAVRLDELANFYRACFLDQDLGNEPRSEAARLAIELWLSMRKYREAHEFMELGRDVMPRLMGRRYYYLRLTLSIRQGDYDEAYRQLVDLEKDPEIDKDHNFRNLRHAVNSMRGGMTQLEVDWDQASKEANAARYSDAGDKIALQRFLRNTLDQVAGAVHEREDKMLYDGALAAYRRAFSRYKDIYQPGLEKYLRTRREKIGDSPLKLAVIQQRLTLLPPKDTSANLPIPDKSKLSWPESENDELYSFVGLAEGQLEYSRRRDFFNKRVLKTVPAGVTEGDSGIKVCQTSRQVLCIRDGSLLWQRIFPNSTMKTGSDSRLLPTAFRPAIADGVVIVRFLRDSRIGLFGFAADSGELLWEHHSDSGDICTDPVAGDGRLAVIVKQDDEISRYLLKIIDTRSGDLLLEQFLFAGQDVLSINHYASSVRIDAFLPFPTSVDGVLYLTTNAGVCFALSRDSGAVLWARKYPQMPFSTSRDLSFMLEHRRNSSPVAGKENILFASRDGVALQLLKRDTGELIAENTELEWREIYPWNNDEALVFDADGKATVYSLANFAEKMTLPGRNYEYMRGFKQGVLLRKDRELKLFSWDGKPVRTMTLPQNFLPFPGQNDLRFGYRTDRLLPELVYWGKETEYLAVEEPVPTRLESPMFMPLNGERLLLADNYVQRLADNFLPRWSIPWMTDEQAVVIRNGDRLFLFSSGSVSLFDWSTGRLIQQYPRPGDSFVRLMAPASDGEGVLFASQVPDARHCDILRLDGSGVESIGRVPRDNVLAVLDGGKQVFCQGARDRKSLDLFEREDHSAKYSEKQKAVSLKGEYYKYERIYPPPAAKVLFCGEKEAWGDLSDKGFARIDYRQPEPRGGHFYRKTNRYNAEAVAMHRNREQWRVIDTDSMQDITNHLNSRYQPVLGDGIAATVAEKRRNVEYESAIYDLRTSKALPSRKIDLRMRKNWGDLEYEFGVHLPGTAVFYIFRHGGHRPWNHERIVLVHDIGENKISMKRFPPLPEWRDGLGSSSHVAFLGKDNIQIMEREKFLALGDALGSLVSGIIIENRDKQAEFADKAVIDGYPDEWGDDVFVDLGKNRIAARLVHHDIYLLLEINDPAWISLLGRRGADNLRVHLLTPSIAGLDFISDRGVMLKASEDLGTETELSYSFLPTGERGWLELRVPLKDIYGHRDHFRRSIIKLPGRDIRGDLAIDVQISDDSGKNPSSLFSEELKPPAWYPRIRFEQE